MGQYIVVFITTASSKEAESISKALVEEGLAACGNILPEVHSLFKWKGKFCEEKERLLLIKSKESLFPKIVERVKKLHSYEVPEIIALPIASGEASYLKWIDEVTKSP